jgi:hypothetical protein
MKKKKDKVNPKKKRITSEKKGEEQLDLGIREPFKNRFFKIKRDIDLAILKFEVRKFLKDPLLWASLVIGLVLIGHQVYLIIENLDNLPVYLPIFRHFIVISKKLVVKDYIIVFPIISSIALILSLVFTSRYYNSDKILTKFLLFASLLCIVSQSIILIDLIRFF